LGCGAVRYLLDRIDDGYKTGALISVQSDRIVPIPFDEILNPQTGKTVVRKLDINSDLYKAARSMMVRLEKNDFDNIELLKNIAKAAKMTVEEFRKQYEHLIE
ncbi:MAG: 6-phosphofructokinase, partial [bacterium]|nr:6-phosphofructokinase [bacterium]